FTWALTFDGNKVAGQSKEYAVEPGTRQVVGITLPLPSVRPRAEGELVLTLEVGGREVYRDTKALSVLNTEAGAVPEGLARLGAATAAGRVAFGEDMTRPALRGLQPKDFFTWGDDEVLFRNAYGKPARGAKSLIQCGDSLQNSALIEVPAGKGLLLLCQLTAG